MNPLSAEATALLMVIAFAMILLGIAWRPRLGRRGKVQYSIDLFDLGVVVAVAVLTWNAAALAW